MSTLATKLKALKTYIKTKYKNTRFGADDGFYEYEFISSPNNEWCIVKGVETMDVRGDLASYQVHYLPLYEAGSQPEFQTSSNFTDCSMAFFVHGEDLSWDYSNSTVSILEIKKLTEVRGEYIISYREMISSMEIRRIASDSLSKLIIQNIVNIILDYVYIQFLPEVSKKYKRYVDKYIL